MIKLQNYIDGGSLGDALHEERTCDGDNNPVCKAAIVKPDGAQGRSLTLPQQMAEARDFITQFYESCKMTDSAEQLARLVEVETCLESTGTYVHTTEELEFAARQAWRNAGRCIGRIQWKNLKTFDARHVETAAEMFECIKEHLVYATNGGNIRAAITIFPPKQNGKQFRVWNPQLIQYAGYKKGGSIIGDPINVDLTQLLQSLGWKGRGGRFDILPLLLQANSEDPEWFELPPELCLEVQLRHPDYPWFKELGLKWYAVPAVADMRFEVGGLDYTGAPFSGWYMGTEIGARDLCDEQRYNLLLTIGQMMGLDTKRPSSLWKDRAIVEANVAVIHSYQLDRVTITDHHTASESFIQHLNMETTTRGGCPADWVWIVPPISGSVCPVFHQEMVNYTLKPSYAYQAKAWAYDRFGMPCLPGKVKQKIRLRFKTLVQSIIGLLGLRMYKSANMTTRTRVTILYATETGRSLAFSRQLAKTLKKNMCLPTVVCMDDYDVNQLQEEENLLVITSTFGTGDPPENGRKFWSAIENLKEPPNLEMMMYAVLALGSTLYPDFCQFGKDMDSFLSQNGAWPICPVQEADEMKGQESVFKKWSKTIVETLVDGAVEESQAIYRCVFIKNGQTSSTSRHLSHLHNTDTKRVEVTQVMELQGKGTTPKYFDIQFSAEDNKENLHFEPGDHLQIHSSNQVQHVNMVLGKLRVAPEQYNEPLILQVFDSETETWHPDERFPEELTLTQALTWFLDLMAPASHEFIDCVNDMDGLRRNSAVSARRHSGALLNRGQMRRSSEFVQSIGILDLERLNIIHAANPTVDEGETTTNDAPVVDAKMPLSYLEVIQKAKPQSIYPEMLLRHVTTIKLRKYSISTAPLYERRPVYNVTFKEIVYTRNGTKLKGLATGYMSSLSVTQSAYVSVSVAHAFRLAMAASRPSLMIAQGTGISPFRSFWRHKLALHQSPEISSNVTGDLHLYYGCRNQDIDCLFREEVLAMKKRGILKDVKMAYSRDKSMAKTYVQHLLVQNAEEVGKLVYEDQGYIFYCGDISNWDEICQLLSQVLQGTARLSKHQAKHYLKQMMQDKRLTRDIFMD